MIHPSIWLSVIAAISLGGAALANAAHASSDTGQIACGVSTATDKGMLAIEGVLQSPDALQGEYRFALKSSGAGGSTNINQGGQFSASPGMPVSLGRVMVNAGSAIDVDFSVTAGGKKFDCSQQFTATT